jgi:hypothetical protein
MRLHRRLSLALVVLFVFAGRGQAQVEIGLNFTATTALEFGWYPPDSMMAVGEEHIAEFLNGSFKVYRKTDGAVLQSKSMNQFWLDAGVTPNFFHPFDPRILYDPPNHRWFALSVDGGVPNNFLVAVSQGADPSQGWSAFKIPADTTGQRWADYPMLGLNRDGVFVTANNFDAADNFLFSANLLVLPKTDLLAAIPTVANSTLIEGLHAVRVGLTPQPVVDLDQATGDGILLSEFSILGQYIRADVEGGVSSPSVPPAGVQIPTDGFAFPPLGPQPGPKQGLDICCGDSRFQANVVLRDGALWGVSTVAHEGRAALRWVQIGAGTNEILQAGLISDDQLSFYYGSIAVNAFGDVVIGMNGSSESQFVSSYAVVGSTAGGVTSFGEPMLLKQGVSDYGVVFDNRNRWGDYSATVVDPTDPKRFWTIQEFVVETDVWATQITELKVQGKLLALIDIKPASDPNSINPMGQGVIPVAILGSDTFDVADVDASTLAFGPAGAPLAHRNGPHLKDPNDDGIPDLLAHFPTLEAGIAFADEEACVTGELLDGTPFEGCDSVVTVPPR